jgi:hypothetical protein
MEVESSV